MTKTDIIKLKSHRIVKYWWKRRNLTTNTYKMKTVKEIQKDFAEKGIVFSEIDIQLLQSAIVMDIARTIGNTHDDPAMALKILDMLNDANVKNHSEPETEYI